MTTVYDTTMRNDPFRKAAVLEEIKHRQEVFAKAQALLNEASTLPGGLGRIEDDPLLARCVDAVRHAAARVASDADFILEEPTDCYLGNRAASGSPRGWSPTTG